MKYLLYPELSYMLLVIGCKSVHKFWSYRPKCDFVWMIHMSRIHKRIILKMLQCLAVIKVNIFTFYCVAESSHLVTILMTDTHTHRHTHTQTHTQTDRQTDKPSGGVKNIIPFFKGIIISLQKRYDAFFLLQVCVWFCSTFLRKVFVFYSN